MEISPNEVVECVISVLLDVPKFALDVVRMVGGRLVFMSVVEREAVHGKQIESIFVQIQVHLVVIDLDLP